LQHNFFCSNSADAAKYGISSLMKSTLLAFHCNYSPISCHFRDTRHKSIAFVMEKLEWCNYPLVTTV